MLAILVKFIHLVVCLALIVIVLFQADKGEGLAGAFGGGASATLFGERGAETQISKMTTYLAIIFMITSLIIAVWGPDWEKQAQSQSYVHSTSGEANPVGQNPVQNPLNPMNPMGFPMGGTVAPSAPAQTAPAQNPVAAPESNPVTAPAATENATPVETRESNTTAPETTAIPSVPVQAPVSAPVNTETTNTSDNPTILPSAMPVENKPQAPTEPMPSTTGVPGI